MHPAYRLLAQQRSHSCDTAATTQQLPFHGPQAAQTRAGVRFLRHDVRTAHDDVSDVARLYRIRAVPTFVFLVGGAKVPGLVQPLECLSICRVCSLHCWYLCVLSHAQPGSIRQSRNM